MSLWSWIKSQESQSNQSIFAYLSRMLFPQDDSEKVIVRVGQGKGQQEFKIDKGLLAYHSSRLRQELYCENQERQKSTILLPNEDSQVFSIFVCWLLTGRLIIADFDLMARQNCLCRCLDCGQRFGMLEFRNAVFNVLFLREVWVNDLSFGLPRLMNGTPPDSINQNLLLRIRHPYRMFWRIVGDRTQPASVNETMGQNSRTYFGRQLCNRTEFSTEEERLTPREEGLWPSPTLFKMLIRNRPRNDDLFTVSDISNGSSLPEKPELPFLEALRLEPPARELLSLLETLADGYQTP